MKQHVSLQCACPCGKSQFQVHAIPFARIFCHCTICQQVYKKPYSDLTMLWAKDLVPADKHLLETRKYKRGPALDRSICTHCKNPVHAFFSAGPFKTLAFVPTANYPQTAEVPASEAHVYYHRCQAPVNDALAKHSGALHSQLALTSILTRGIARDLIQR